MNEHFDLTYKSLFRRYYTNLLFYATRIVGEEDAEDVVQDVFVELWKRKDTMKVGEQIQAFLYRAVYTRALNVLKHRDLFPGVLRDKEAESALVVDYSVRRQFLVGTHYRVRIHAELGPVLPH